MIRTNYYRPSSMGGIPSKDVSTWTEFLTKNRLLLFFSLLFVVGALIGVVVFGISQSLIGGELTTMLESYKIDSGWKGNISALFSSSFSTILLLGVLFLLGLSACGAPFAVVIPLFFGMGLGLTEAYYYSTGILGMAAASLLVVPHYLVAAVALVLGSIESIRMSLLFSRQILPGAVMGGLWSEFKLYCVRFLFFIGIAFASGVLDVCFRLIFGSFFK